MSNEVVISVENLGKCYQLGSGGSGERYTALRDVIANKAKSLFRSQKTHFALVGQWGRAMSWNSIQVSAFQFQLSSLPL